MGLLYPLAGLIMFIVAAVLCSEQDADLKTNALEHGEEETTAKAETKSAQDNVDNAAIN